MPQRTIITVDILNRKKRDMYEDFLKSVEVLKSMDHYERSKLATVIKEKKFNANDMIIREVRTYYKYEHAFRGKKEIHSI